MRRTDWRCPLVAAIGFAVALASALPATRVAAQSEAAGNITAEQLVAAADVAYDAGNYRQALDYYQQAYERSGDSKLLFEIGQAADKQHLDETALRALKLYLEKVPDAANRTEVEQRIVVLEDMIQAKEEQARLAGDAPLALSPAAAAETTRPVADPSIDYTEPRDEDNLLTKWWLWTGVGVVVTATVITVVALSGGTETHTREPFSGTSGKVVMTLGRAR